MYYSTFLSIYILEMWTLNYASIFYQPSMAGSKSWDQETEVWKNQWKKSSHINWGGKLIYLWSWKLLCYFPLLASNDCFFHFLLTFRLCVVVTLVNLRLTSIIAVLCVLMISQIIHTSRDCFETFLSARVSLLSVISLENI